MQCALSVPFNSVGSYTLTLKMDAGFSRLLSLTIFLSFFSQTFAVFGDDISQDNEDNRFAGNVIFISVPFFVILWHFKKKKNHDRD